MNLTVIGELLGIILVHCLKWSQAAGQRRAPKWLATWPQFGAAEGVRMRERKRERERDIERERRGERGRERQGEVGGEQMSAEQTPPLSSTWASGRLNGGDIAY